MEEGELEEEREGGEEEEEEDNQYLMNSLMGFASFDSTQQKHVKV